MQQLNDNSPKVGYYLDAHQDLPNSFKVELVSAVKKSLERQSLAKFTNKKIKNHSRAFIWGHDLLYIFFSNIL